MGQSYSLFNGIKEAIDKVMSEINASVAKKFEGCKSWWEARAIHREICDSISGIKDMPALSDFDGRSLSDFPELYVRRTFSLNGSKVRASNYEHKRRIETKSNVRVVVQDTDTKFDKNCRYLVAEEDVLPHDASGFRSPNRNFTSAFLSCAGQVSRCCPKC